MIEDMVARKLNPHTQRSHIHSCKRFAAYLKRSPDNFHIVFTLPAAIADIAYQNKAVTDDLLFKASSETMLRIAADPKNLGAHIGITAVLHSWGSAMTHRPHAHMIVPGGGLSWTARWIAASRVSSAVRALEIVPAPDAGKAPRRAGRRQAEVLWRMRFSRRSASLRHLPCAAEESAMVRVQQTPLRRAESGACLSLSLYPPCRHLQQPADLRRCQWRHFQMEKDYRAEGRERFKTMTLATGEFIRRFLLHVLPKGLHRIRHYGLFASGAKADDLTAARDLLAAPAPAEADASESGTGAEKTCPSCGGRMHIIEVFNRGETPRHRPSPAPATIRIDTS